MLNTAPLCRCAAGQGGPRPPACITSPCGARHAGTLRVPRSRMRWTRMSGDPQTPLPGRFAPGRGLCPQWPRQRGRCHGAGRPLRPSAPPAGLVPLGREHRPGQRVAGRLPRCCAAAPGRQLPRRSRIKTVPIRRVEEGAQNPAATEIASSGRYGRSAGCTARGASGVGIVRLLSLAVLRGTELHRSAKATSWLHTSRKSQGKHRSPIFAWVGGCFAFAQSLHHHPVLRVPALG